MNLMKLKLVTNNFFPAIVCVAKDGPICQTFAHQILHHSYTYNLTTCYSPQLTDNIYIYIQDV